MIVQTGAPQCSYFTAGRCRSCTHIETPIAQQRERKQVRCRDELPMIDAAAWLPIVGGADREFRNRAKLVAGGSRGAMTLGILSEAGTGVDLTHCLIHEASIRRAIPRIAKFVNGLGIEPYLVRERRGELKYVHVTAGDSGALMVRFVVRSRHGLGQIERAVPALRQEVPEAIVVSVNLLPTHVALLEGDEEQTLVGEDLPVTMGDVTLRVRPQGFLQTNTEVSAKLYRQVTAWIVEARPQRVWDAYCGVGGFALHAGRALADSVSDVRGFEVTSEAIVAARRSASEMGLPVEFEVADAVERLRTVPSALAPDAMIVNPPRRGLGVELSRWVNGSAIRHLAYSSCQPQSLARDLAEMPNFRVQRARAFDMFPHTDHVEVAVWLERQD